MNKIQTLVANLVRASSFNDFDGDQVINDLGQNEDKWDGFIWGNFSFCKLIPLRDIERNVYNVDTMYIKLPADNLDWLKSKSKEWRVDEFGYYTDGELGGVVDENLKSFVSKDNISELGGGDISGKAIVRLWWD